MSAYLSDYSLIAIMLGEFLNAVAVKKDLKKIAKKHLYLEINFHNMFMFSTKIFTHSFDINYYINIVNYYKLLINFIINMQLNN